MPEPDIAAVIMAGGLGTRMRSAVPKHFHPLLGRRMVDWIVEAARELGAEPVVVSSPACCDGYEGVRVAVQEKPLGTGDAVRCARAELEARGGDVLVLSGDTPLLTADLLRALLDTHRSEGAAATVLTFEPDDLRSYGRVLRGGDGHVRAIVEAADANADELSVRECNSSIYVFRADRLWPALERLEPHNAQGELYLTDAVRHLVADGDTVAAHVAADPRETEGDNTRVELAAAAALLRDRIMIAHMLAAVPIVDPQ
jgi:bifunctional UDP-N-acetylglucosamine pyrophosphorylase/glucosamine-1-phosphate N-acetyltransferase